MNGWSLVRFLHVTAAIGWVGGQLTLSTVVLPVLRVQFAPAARVAVIRATARRFALIANTTLLPTLIVTGIALAGHRGVALGSLDDPGYGRTLGIKLLFVAASIAVAAVHGTLARARPRFARPLAVLGVALAVAIVVFATALVP